MEESLITAVEKRQALYDKTDDNYSNRVYVNKQWKEISEELGIPDEIVRKKWSTLRDYFKKSHKQLTIVKPVAVGEKRKKWYLYNNMLFLLPHLTDRKPCFNWAGSESDDEEFISTNSEEGIPLVDSILPEPSGPASVADPSDPEDSQPQTSTGGQQQAVSIPGIRVKRKRKANFPQEDSKEFVRLDSDYLQDSSKNSGVKIGQPVVEKDEDELFLQSMVPKLKLLDPLMKQECHAEIHMLILKYVRAVLAPKLSEQS
ncbi:transcription factor adf-1 [Plakobranchus ocellatus]|uniref:Transcription factor adf-1 n=1 Tax=Plakobranchus ocellatus TaxID=259542 RepID=A0AAV3ZWJ4_9GAST|nr:transcription factor adf-1 [Plakobranchus ocellatus]